jgi:glucose/arabinose dehydrogenase
MPRVVLAVILALVVSSCAGSATLAAPIGPGTTAPMADQAAPQPVTGNSRVGLRLERIVTGLEEPVAITLVNGDRLLVAERNGRIRLIEDGQLLEKPLVDLTGRLATDSNEQGLLGIALQERPWSEGRLFVLSTDPNGNVQLVEYPVDATFTQPWFPLRGRVVMTVRQPHKNHQGGGMLFGPDGYLWVSFGDGGGIGDPFGNGQDPYSLLGTIVRIDVDGARPYAIPPDNPFADGSGGAPEVWGYGLRNPWRFSIDEPTGRVYIADVGQYDYEEIDVVPTTAGGANFGWPVVEGPQCFADPACDPGQFVAPVHALAHENLCAIVGGGVYRGGRIPELAGHYFYGDFCVGWIRSLLVDEHGTVAEIRDWTEDLGTIGKITTFGVDGAGEILVATREGDLFRIVPERAGPGS